MSNIHVPIDRKKWPTLGPQVCDFMEKNLVFGPGDLRGNALVLDDERRFWIYRMYEVFPKSHPLAGRRRFQRAGLSRRKGIAKTEFAALLAACELHPEAPVRCVGWTPKGDPIGGGVKDPYIPMVAYTEEQSSELAYSALKVILENSHLRDDFDIGLERIMRRKGDGVAVSLSTNPSARDGARTTFAVMDETHWMTSDRHRLAHQTMLNNLPKRRAAQAWMLEVTTAPEPGSGSVAEATMNYAKDVADGKVTDASLFYFHVQAGDHHDLTTEEGVRAAVIEASGMAESWSDIDAIVNRWKDPDTDKALFERLWLNRLVKGGGQAFDILQWKALHRQDYMPKPGALITLGFDGAQFFDSTSLKATEIATGFQWTAGLWERPAHLPKEKPWAVPADEVDATVCLMFDVFEVWRMYADPPFWQTWISKWAGQFAVDKGGTKVQRVVEWYTNRTKQMSVALENYKTAMREGTLSHDGDARAERHLANARRRDLQWTDDEGKPLWVITKERPDSPKKIDDAMAGCLSWEARTDAIAAGVKKKRSGGVMFV